jgi:GMP synthase (glutamine-hydrolysing)
VHSRRAIVLQNVEPEAPGLVAQALQAKGIELSFARPFRNEPIPRELEGASGLVVMGGPMSVYEADRFTYLGDEMKLIEKALTRGCPVLGICLGSQLLARVLGADVRKGAKKEIGWHTVRLTEAALLDPLLKGLESSFTSLHWHGDVFDLPPGAVCLARSEWTENQAFCHGTSAYGFLFHMEMTPEIVEGLLQAFPDDIRDAGLTARAILDGAEQHLGPLSERGRRVFAGWADLAAAHGDAAG